MPQIFGPILAAGTVVEEQEAGKTIVPSQLGTTLYVGTTEKGEVGEISDCPTQKQFLRKVGTYHPGTELPDCALDFYRLGQGAGRLYVVRVTDGLEVESKDIVLGRHPGTGEYVNRTTGDEQKVTMLSVTAKNGGRWGGGERVLSKDYTIATDLTETTLDTGETMLEDEFEGATLTLLGVTTKSYTIASNDTDGVVTVAADATMASDLAAGDDPANNSVSIVLDSEVRGFTAPGSVAGVRRALSLIWLDGEEDPSLYFGLHVVVDGVIVRKYANLSLDPTSKWNMDAVINEDPDNDFIVVSVTHTGSFVAANRPANWFGEYKAFAAGTLTAEIAHIRSVVPTTPANDIGFVTDFVYPAATVRQRITITLTSDTEFSVTTSAGWGAEHKSLPSGTVGTAYATTLGSDSKALLTTMPTFTVLPGVDDFESGDVIVVDIEPFPVELSSGTGLLAGLVWIDGDDANSERLQIESNTVNTITLKNSPTVAPSAASGIAADLVSSGDITFPTTGGIVTIITDIAGYDAVELEFGAEADAATLVATLNATAAATGLPATLFSATGDKLNVELSAVYDAASSNTGEDQFFEFVTGTALTELLITAGVSTGVRGDSFRVQAPRELRDGYDGSTPADADYLAIYNSESSPINRLRGRNVGLVKLATPAVTTTAIQKGGNAYANFRNYQYRIEFPANITSETSAVEYVNNTIGRSDRSVGLWPSAGKLTNPQGNGLVTQSLTGAIHGLEAANARNSRGYHKALDASSGVIPNMIEHTLGDAELNTEILNPVGIQVVLKKKGNFTVWGDRTLALDPGWKWKHKREYLSWVGNVLIENFDWIIFALNDATTQEILIPVLQEFFRPEWLKRAIQTESGKFEDAARIKVDSENNTASTRELGDLHAEIGLTVVNTVERMIFSVSEAGIFES